MINRVLIRIKVIQLLYAWMQNPKENIQAATDELARSIDKAYELYHWLLQLPLAINDYAVKRIEAGMNKLRPTEEERKPNIRFINNELIKHLAKNEALQLYVKEHGISWSEYDELIRDLFNTIAGSELYKTYMEHTERDFDEDKMLWRNIYKKILAPNEALTNQLEDINIFWNDDLEIVYSFVEKTIKRLDLTQAPEQQPLLPMYNNEEDVNYGKELLETALKNQERYLKMIETTAKNWKSERIATMDMAIMTAALAEIEHFPTIPVSVTLNEYIEDSKYYSTESSYNFINGVLDKIVNELRESGKLLKAGATVKQ
ncbi:MAG: transcription antitermination factor NusB [Paludibacteraceae bacterium]|nr:transcription antitermination factor NusB [Paludibacteraceae bacterium]